MEEEICIISSEEFKISQEKLQVNRWIHKQNKLQFIQIQKFINTNDISYLMPSQNEYYQQERLNNVINFCLLDSYPTDDSYETDKSEAQQIPIIPSVITKKQIVQKDIQKTSQIIIKQVHAMQEQKPKPIEQIQTEIKEEKTDILIRPTKHKKQHFRQQMKEYEMDQDQSGLTYYQRKKNFIQKMKNDEKLLDWDSYKKEDLIYEQTSIGGVLRRKKNKKQIDIIELPHPTSYQLSYNSYQKEAKSYRKIPRSQRLEQKTQNNKVTANANGKETKNEGKAQIEQTEIYEPYKQFEMVSVDRNELIKRREDFLQKKFISSKSVQPNTTYVSSKAQAIIPQIKPVDEVRNTWILKDLDSLLAYKNTKEYQLLEEYMNKFFGVRTPWQVYNILKINKNNLKSAIDYCNMNCNELKFYFSNKDIEGKKKKTQKRQLEKKKYV